MRCAAESGVALNKITVASKGFKLDSSLILHCPRFPDRSTGSQGRVLTERTEVKKTNRDGRSLHCTELGESFGAGASTVRPHVSTCMINSWRHETKAG